ncbi:MAG: nucleotidyl transferase AbiEii/AbiGii toxin family protein [Planctomycetes bacterium]|nr:nucleotidyl transferase AbiEii/AbiGii toxin family protein [Planctomycetota bacterium]
MSSFARLPEDKRRAAVEEGAARLGVLPVIVEKDYWVCWLLGRIFQDAELARNIVFKGGTTLSKVFGVIDRFSEDIDLSVSPKILGFTESTLDNESSKGKRAKLFENLQVACAKFVAGRFRPQLEKTVRELLGAHAGIHAWFVYREDARTHSPVLLFEYPSSLPPERGYIEPAVKLEFGSLTDQQPTGTRAVKPMLADVIPAFKDETEQVVALEVERTFWEKATILHVEYHRPAERPIPDRFSRHYSDFAALWRHSAKDAALKRLDLLDQVAIFKSRFFASGWSHYETAKPGTLKLSPSAGREAELQRDYAKMEPMFLKSPPPFAEVLKALGDAQREINADSKRRT